MSFKEELLGLEIIGQAGWWWRTSVIPALWEAEAGGSLSWRPAWSTE